MICLLSPMERMAGVAKYLSQQFEMSPKGEEVFVYSHMFGNNISPMDIMNIVSKFANEFGIIEIKHDWAGVKSDSEQEVSRFVCGVKKKEGFDEYAYELINKVTAMYSKQKSENKEVLWLSYDYQGHLVLNDVFLITTTRPGLQNDRLLTYLLGNPNKKFTRASLQAANVLDEGEDKDFPIFLNDIKIFGSLRTLFFPKKHRSNDSIYLKNPILFKDLKENNIELLDFNTLLKPKKQKSDEI